MTPREQITADLKEAMKARDQVRVDTLRSALSAFSYRRIDAGRELEADEQLDVIRKLVKQRNDSITEFGKAGRAELVAKETRERDLLQAFVPREKSADEIRAVVREALAALPPDQRNQGAAMKVLMPKLKGETDGGTIRTVVLEELKSLTTA
ncbi:MAG TPA: GatB/YqeY domain-containing protein [Candidatus Baltobacteraceae bacterium]